MHFTDVAFLQFEGKIISQQEDNDSLSCGGLEPKLQYLQYTCKNDKSNIIPYVPQNAPYVTSFSL